VDKAKPFDIPKREVWEAFKKVKANQGRLEWMGSRLQSLSPDFRTTFTSCGTDCPRGPRSLRRAFDELKASLPASF
jgi:hypothetical protein